MSQPGDPMDCIRPGCGSVAINITPLKGHDRSIAIFACQGCGHAFRADGGAYVEDATKLRDVFRGATMAGKTLTEVFAGESLNPATRALLLARLTEYGLQMWMDGVKQGILLGTIQSEKGAGNDNG